MEEISNSGFDPSPVIYLVVAAGLVLLSFRALWKAARQQRQGPVLTGLWLMSVVVFCAAAAMLFGVTEWVPYEPEIRSTGGHDPQAGMGQGLALLVYNAVLVVICAVVLSTLVLVSAGRKRPANPSETDGV